MHVKQITVKLGMTQNLGDYSNCRPEIEIVAHLNDGERPDVVIDGLLMTAHQRLTDMVDTELEAAGREPKYFPGQRYCVAYNNARQCIVLYRQGLAVPDESNWKYSDSWRRADSAPLAMRPNTASRIADALSEKTGYAVWIVEDAEGFSDIPSLPIDGPEPAWHSKKLEARLRRLDIPEEHWDEVALLEHVDNRYLDLLYNHNLEYEPLEVRLVTIRSGAEDRVTVASPASAETTHEECDEDEDDDDYGF